MLKLILLIFYFLNIDGNKNKIKYQEILELQTNLKHFFQMNEIKKNIRKFSGFPFEKDSTEFARKKASVEK